MSTRSNAVPETIEPQNMAPAAMKATRPMYWSVRRELWESRWIYIAPLAVAPLFLIGFLISMVRLPASVREALILDPEKQRAAILAPYETAAGLIMAAVTIVALFYCLEALHSERRDRSILFWKSLPVSDLTTVLAKTYIPFALPLFGFVITVSTQFIMLLISSAVVAANGLSVKTLWTEVSLYQMSVMLLYHLVTVHVLWYAPAYTWLLLVSGWARRAALLWAVLPPLALCFVEKIAFNTWHFANMLLYRLSGPEAYNFEPPGSTSMSHMVHSNLWKFLSTPGLWIGLAVAAGFLGAAVRLRRHRGPI